METTVSDGPMVYQVRLKPNYGKRDEREERGERKVPAALLRTKRYNSKGTPLYLQDQKSVVMHRLIYKWSQARGTLRRVAKIRLVNTSDGGKSPSGFSLDPPKSAARHLTSRHDLNNLNPVSGIRSS